jgi:histidine triad (HIT) family protein
MTTKFSRIIAGELPGSFVYKDDRVAAFMSIQQMNDGHVLVVPVKAATCLAELDDDTAGHLFVVAIRIAAAIRKSGLKCEGVNLFLADGSAAGQDVFHVHLHVIPRFADDGFDLVLTERWHLSPSRAELDSIASKIRTVMEESV